ncbi:hypothetical protein LshimejAT787_0400780 [Lyophyllum shimeji]|uniref:Uncharacterized protein n=1 Tax=Lyophyllum shimeji TaxID=47721 RepID=A0A9P3PIW8_LYOSH|nr:hypothetical protein LshimejAT787_0400780 [Lyophyllum shimeji]
MSGLHDVLAAERETAEGRKQGPVEENKLAPGLPIRDTLIDKDAEAQPGEKIVHKAADTITEERHNGHQQYRKKSPKIHYNQKKPPEVLE